ncbi:MAG: heterodisulfide reductase subunit C [Euryarchaeota archaeon]|nr:heterodisulfide reductase subunit C [Euryarchaeota archaeon]
MTSMLPDVIRLKECDPSFVREVMEAGGQGVSACFACGTCVAGCPTVEAMDHPPRRLMRMINLGMREEVLASDTVWLCASCNTCNTRCPRGVEIPNVMAAVKSIAIREGVQPDERVAPVFYQEMVDSMVRYGRLFEPRMMLMVSLRSGQGVEGLMKNAPLGLELFKKGKLPLRPHRIKGTKQLKTILENIRTMEGGK